MKRKWIAGLLTAAMVSAALIGCGGNKEPVGTDTGTEAAGMKEAPKAVQHRVQTYRICPGRKSMCVRLYVWEMPHRKAVKR